MSTLKVNALNNNGSAIDLPNSFKLGGNPIEQGYTSSATEPTSPSTGDLWWDSANETLYQYLNGEFKELSLKSPYPWLFNFADISYDSLSQSTTNEAAPRTVRLSVDGTRLYYLGSSGQAVQEWSMSTAWDFGTLSSDSSFSVSSQATTPQSMDFSYDGTKMFVLQNGGTIYQYSLSTAFDTSTASYDSTSFDLTTVNSANTYPHGMMFSIDGTKLYTCDYVGDKIYQYSLSTAYDLSTISYDSSFGSASQFQQPGDIYLNRAGTHIYIPDANANVIKEIVMSTALDLSTASLTSTTFSYTSQGTDALGLHFSEDGTKMYILNYNNDTIFQYTSGASA